MRILVVHGEGLGNIIQILPLIATLRSHNCEVDLMLANSSFDFPKDILDMKVYRKGDELEGEYNGKIETVWGKIHGPCCPSLKLLNMPERQQMRLDMSEVEVYLGAAQELGISPEKFVYDCSDILRVDSDSRYDVVFSDGYNWKAGDLWKAKSWSGHKALASMLANEGLRCCSIGSDGEGVIGTDLLTGIGLGASLSLIKGSKVMVSNDSGFYHCASAMGIPTVVAFTFTSVIKNMDSNFHASARVVGTEMDCRKDCHAHMRWKDCQTHACRDISVENVFNCVMEMIARV